MSAMAADGSNSGRLGAVHVPQAPAGAHGDTVLSIVVSPDGKRAVTGACGLLAWRCLCALLALPRCVDLTRL